MEADAPSEQMDEQQQQQPEQPSIATPDMVRGPGMAGRSACGAAGPARCAHAHGMPPLLLCCCSTPCAHCCCCCCSVLQVKASEKAALNVHKKLSVQAAPVRQYLVRGQCNCACTRSYLRCIVMHQREHACPQAH